MVYHVIAVLTELLRHEVPAPVRRPLLGRTGVATGVRVVSRHIWRCGRYESWWSSGGWSAGGLAGKCCHQNAVRCCQSRDGGGEGGDGGGVGVERGGLGHHRLGEGPKRFPHLPGDFVTGFFAGFVAAHSNRPVCPGGRVRLVCGVGALELRFRFNLAESAPHPGFRLFPCLVCLDRLTLEFGDRLVYQTRRTHVRGQLNHQSPVCDWVDGFLGEKFVLMLLLEVDVDRFVKVGGLAKTRDELIVD